MAKVRISIAGREYALTCADGDEDRVRELGARLDKEASAIAGKMAFVSEANLLVMTALQIADQSGQSASKGPASTPTAQPAEPPGLPEETVVSLLNDVTNAIESVAASINKG